MNKLMTVVAVSVCAVSFSAQTAEVPSTTATDIPSAEELTEEESSPIEGGFDLDFLSADVWHNSIGNDRMVLQPCVWADWTFFDPFYAGFWISQNYNLTDRLRHTFRHALSETDYNIHLGTTLWSDEAEENSLGVEIGHEWYTYHDRVDDAEDEIDADDNPDTRELYAKLTYDNPFIDVYGQACWMYDDFGNYEQGLYYELGFTKEFELCDSLTLGADWNVSFGDKNYLEFLYGSHSARYAEDEDGEEYLVSESFAQGLAATTAKVYLTWSITDWLSVGGTIAYTGILNGDLRKEYGLTGFDYHGCHRDFVWGGFSLNLTF